MYTSAPDEDHHKVNDVVGPGLGEEARQAPEGDDLLADWSDIIYIIDII